jgi:DNA-binding transcriptional LysR family regulator
MTSLNGRPSITTISVREKGHNVRQKMVQMLPCERSEPLKALSWNRRREQVSQTPGVARRAAVTTFSFAAMPGLVVHMPFIAAVHRRLAAPMVNAWPVIVRESPIAFDVMDQGVQWPKYHLQVPGILWLRQLAKQAATKMDQTSE